MERRFMEGENYEEKEHIEMGTLGMLLVELVYTGNQQNRKAALKV